MRVPCPRTALITPLAVVLLLPLDAGATAVDDAEARTVARNWASYVARETDGWAGVSDPGIAFDARLESNDGRLLAYVFSVTPDALVVVPALRELPPVKLYAETGFFDTDAAHGLVVHRSEPRRQHHLAARCSHFRSRLRPHLEEVAAGEVLVRLLGERRRRACRLQTPGADPG